MSSYKINITESQRERLWNKNYINLLVVNVFLYLSFFLVTPILSVYAISLGATLAFAGMIVGVFAITVLVLGPFGGVLADRTNKKYLMIIATILNAISTLGYSVSPNLVTLMLFRILHGASFSVTSASGLAWVTDFIPKKRLGEGIGYLGIAQITATAFGPQIGIFVSEQYGLRITFVIAAVLLLIGVLCMSLVSNKQKGFVNAGSEKTKLSLSNMIAVEVLPLSFIAGLFSMGSGLVSSFLVLLGQERSITGVGLYFTVNALLLLVTRPFSGKLYDKKGLSFIMYPALIFAMAEAFLLGRASALWMIVLAAVFKAFGQGIAQPAIQAESIHKMGEDKRGIASSTYYIGASIGQGFGPLVGGILATSVGYEGMFNFCALMLIFGIVGYYVYSKSNINKNVVKLQEDLQVLK